MLFPTGLQIGWQINLNGRCIMDGTISLLGGGLHGISGGRIRRIGGTDCYSFLRCKTWHLWWLKEVHGRRMMWGYHTLHISTRRRTWKLRFGNRKCESFRGKFCFRSQVELELQQDRSEATWLISVGGRSFASFWAVTGVLVKLHNLWWSCLKSQRFVCNHRVILPLADPSSTRCLRDVFLFSFTKTRIQSINGISQNTKGTTLCLSKSSTSGLGCWASSWCCEESLPRRLRGCVRILYGLFRI